ncbi:YdaS family helix-turn-helix protein [Pseudomonas aeruginosa]|uniref:YdaS family helix-turn-helix protein n=1 Tax=Pseudomonas nitroreducens TaxID=46680 RepID=UPI00106A411B|nr:YdaS family helix-turn-helix protein [Pseudomonas nitroreducens]MDG9855639.1 helix-turn-helix domain-containing protein [Pseudomonas nitroreducens]
MNPTQDMREALAEAVAAAGGQVGFALELSTPDRLVSQQIVSYWTRRGYLPAEFVIRVEMKIGVSRDRLRPDVFCVPQDLMPQVA